MTRALRRGLSPSKKGVKKEYAYLDDKSVIRSAISIGIFIKNAVRSRDDLTLKIDNGELGTHINFFQCIPPQASVTVPSEATVTSVVYSVWVPFAST